MKNINLRVKNDGEVHISANKLVPLHVIDDFVFENAEYIYSKINGFMKQTSNNMDYKSLTDDYFMLHGKKINVRLIKSDKNHAFLKDDELCMHLLDLEDSKAKNRLFKECMIAYARELFETIAQDVHRGIKVLYPFYPKIGIRYMTSKWGSCRPYKNAITLNLNLLSKSIIETEYVVAHEFCHFVVPNHSAKFYSLLEKFIPDYKEIRKKLNS